MAIKIGDNFLYRGKKPLDERDSFNNIMEIYTTKPGILIGKAGANVEKLENMLSEEYCGVWKVKFIEVRGDFININ